MKKEKKSDDKGKIILSVICGAVLIFISWYYVNVWSEREHNDLLTEEKVSTEHESETLEGLENYLEGEDYLYDDLEEGEKEDSGKTSLIECLEKRDVVIYGSKTCPACASLANSFGGYEAISAIYVECSEDRATCDKNKKTGYVPEIQIEGELYEGGRDPATLASVVNCD